MIYAYMRVSTPQQTMDNQHYTLLKFADQHGLRIDTWITETSRRKPIPSGSWANWCSNCEPRTRYWLQKLAALGDG